MDWDRSTWGLLLFHRRGVDNLRCSLASCLFLYHGGHSLSGSIFGRLDTTKESIASSMTPFKVCVIAFYSSLKSFVTLVMYRGHIPIF